MLHQEKEVFLLPYITDDYQHQMTVIDSTNSCQNDDHDVHLEDLDY